MTPAKIAAALAAIERGWPVFPLTAGRKTPVRRLTDWETRATTDAALIEGWWARHPGGNIGIATGPSRLVVVDLDVPKPDQAAPAGQEQWAELRCGFDVLDAIGDTHGPLPETYTVRTAGGGFHLYYRAPAGAELRNTSGRIGWLIDTRAAGGYVVAAGSTINRPPYQHVLDPPDLPELPQWLHALSAPPPPPPRPAAPPTRRTEGYAGAALLAEIVRVQRAGQGGRNWALNKAAWNLSRFVAAGDLDRHAVERELQAAGEATGLRPAEVAATIRSAITNAFAVTRGWAPRDRPRERP
jgi:hypothetical protein